MCDQGDLRCVESFSDFMYAPLTGPFPSQAHIYTFLHTCATLSQARVHTMGSVSVLPGSGLIFTLIFTLSPLSHRPASTPWAPCLSYLAPSSSETTATCST